MMNALKADPRRRNLAILTAIAIVSIILAALGIWHQTVLTGTKTEAETVFPQLPGAVRKIARIHIVSKAHGVLDIKFNPQKGWVLPQHSNYPAGFEQLRSTVVGLAALQTIQPATSRPGWYGKIAVDAPPKGAGTLIELSDDKGQLLASLIMGKEIDIGDASGAAGIFIRKPGDKQAWLARSVFEPKSDAASWLDKNVIGIDQARIQEADVTPITGESFTVRREKPSDPDFNLAPIPASRELAYEGAADGVATAITGFTFDDVRPATDFDFSNAPRVVIRTFDGLVVTVKIVTQGPDFWATVYAEGAPGKPDAAREARAIDAHADGWAYKLPDYKGKLFMTTLDSLLKPATAKK
ncbi:MAG: DUF4340 domain-containing protein [Proteobacteria bacterium]|nr:DUF4340 domain-containing protein [Pseudomonadota bacterium]